MKPQRSTVALCPEVLGLGSGRVLFIWESLQRFMVQCMSVRGDEWVVVEQRNKICAPQNLSLSVYDGNSCVKFIVHGL